MRGALKGVNTLIFAVILNRNLTLFSLKCPPCVTKENMIVRQATQVFGKYVMKCAATWQSQQSDCAPSEDSDQPGHPPSLIRVFVVRMRKAWVLCYMYPLMAERRLWSDWASAQADLSLRGGRSVILLVLSWGGSNSIDVDFKIGIDISVKFE